MALSWDEIRSRKEKVAGELFSIETSMEVIHDSGVDFLVRLATQLAKKPTGGLEEKAKVIIDPFEDPPSQKLFAGPLTLSHSLIFNKFNLVDNHLVIVTNKFELQTEKLSVADVEAVWKCLVELSGMGFFNGGRLAGASQPHKHLQFVPTPLVSGAPWQLPIEQLLLQPQTLVNCLQSSLFTSPTPEHAHHWEHSGVKVFPHPALPFFNLFALIPEEFDPHTAPHVLHEIYLQMLERSESVYVQHGVEAPFCFNLIFMKRWLLFVPRSLECFDGSSISINTMGFAGTLFVKSPQDFETVKANGPMAILRGLTLPSIPLPFCE